MILAYFRLGKFEDARRSMNQLMKFFRAFRADNPLVEFGDAPYQPKQPTNCVYDTWGAPLGMLRGLFEYLYTADKLTLVPHIPPKLTALQQHFPVRFGAKRLYLATCGSGPVSAVYVNGKPWALHDQATVSLPYDRLPGEAQLLVCLGGAKAQFPAPVKPPVFVAPPAGDELWNVNAWYRNPLGNGHPLRLGADSTGRCQFIGDMRRVRLYDRALTPEQVARIAAEPLGQAEVTPVADFLLDRFADGGCVGAANPDLVARPQGEVAMVDSEGGKVARMTGRGWLEVPCDARLTLRDSYSLETYVKPGTIPERGTRLIDRVTAGVDDGYLLDLWPGGGVRFISEQGHLTAGGWAEGAWTHVVATFDQKEGLRLFVNGKLASSGPIAVQTGQPLLVHLGAFYELLRAEGKQDEWAGAHARLAIQHLQALRERLRREAAGKLAPLSEPSETAANRSYLEAADRLGRGLSGLMAKYEKSEDPAQKHLSDLWQQSQAKTP